MVLFQTGFKPFQLFVALFSLSEESRWFPVMRTMLLSWASQPWRVRRSCEQRLLQSPGCLMGAAEVLRKAREQSSNTQGSCGSQRQPQVLPTGTGAVTSEGSVCDHSVWHKSISDIPKNSSCLAFHTAPGAPWVFQLGGAQFVLLGSDPGPRAVPHSAMAQWMVQHSLCPSHSTAMGSGYSGPCRVGGTLRLLLDPRGCLEVIPAADPSASLDVTAKLHPTNMSCEGFVKL